MESKQAGLGSISTYGIPYNQLQNLDINKNNASRQPVYNNNNNNSFYKMSPQDFIFLQNIGSGSYSEVYKAKYKKSNPTSTSNINNNNSSQSGSNMKDEFFAIKICSKKHIIKEQKEKYVNVEKTTLLQLASEVRHPGIVNLYYTFHDEFNLYFVLDYIPCGELFNYLYNNLNKGVITNDAVVLKFVSQLVDTLYYLKRHLIVHRDLKPENILLNYRGCLMVTDFGVAVSLKDDEGRSSSFVGTADYVSPELLLTNSCSFKADIWALGCIFYQLKQATPPFRGNNELETFENIVSGSYKRMVTMNKNYENLVQGMLKVDERERFDIENIMQHPFCETVNWDNKDEIWTGIWEGVNPIDNNRAYYLKQQRQSEQQQQQQQPPPQQPAGIPIKPITPQPVSFQQPLRTKGIGYPKKRKPVTTQNIVEWRKQLGLGTPYGKQQGTATPLNGAVPLSVQAPQVIKHPQNTVSNNGFNGNNNIDYVNFRPPVNMSSQAAAQIVLKKQIMKKTRNGFPNNQYYQQQPPIPPQQPQQQQQYFQRSSNIAQQPLPPQHMKTGTLRKNTNYNNNSNSSSLSPERRDNEIVKKEDGLFVYKIPYVDKQASLISLDYYSIKPRISASESNCNKFLEFMKRYNMKILDILNSNDNSTFTLQLLGNGEIKIKNEKEGNTTVLGNLSDSGLFIYEYNPEQKEKRDNTNKVEEAGWCVIELERKYLFLLPDLNKEWNKLFKKVKLRNKNTSVPRGSNNSNSKKVNENKSTNEAMIKNAASMAFSK
ncbi:hypothetical protein ACO0SA_002723 [Hanseniaspora valbyensis]